MRIKKIRTNACDYTVWKYLHILIFVHRNVQICFGMFLQRVTFGIFCRSYHVSQLWANSPFHSLSKIKTLLVFGNFLLILFFSVSLTTFCNYTFSIHWNFECFHINIYNITTKRYPLYWCFINSLTCINSNSLRLLSISLVGSTCAMCSSLIQSRNQ